MTETLEQRAARLSIGIGAKVAEVGNAELREALLEDALVEVLEDLIRRGQPLDEAAPMADDIIAGARMIVARLAARG